MVVKLALCMIVKNEEANILRCLKSAKPYINSFTIVDTGSTDKTLQIIEETMKEYEIPGLIVRMDWTNFGHNRTAALQICKERLKADWAIMMDADDSLEGAVIPPEHETWKKEKIDGYNIKVKHGGMVHKRPHIFKLSSNWVYVGAVHEYAACSKIPLPALDDPETDKVPITVRPGILEDFPGTMTLIARTEGFRSQDPLKYLKDVKTLNEELIKDPKNPRTVFYLAQSLYDAGLKEASTKYYEIRANMIDTWAQERYVSLCKLITLSEFDRELQLSYAWTAVKLVPARLEAPHELLKSRRVGKCKFIHEVFGLALVASMANKEDVRQVPADSLFSYKSVYDYAFDDEFSIYAYWLPSNAYKDISLRLCKRMLNQRKALIPDAHIKRIEKNLKLSQCNNK